jgi:hypothetical protein
LAAAKRLLLEGWPHHLAALKANPRNPTYRQVYGNHLNVLAQVHAGLLEQEDAVRTAETRRDLTWNAPADAYDAACLLNLCIPSSPITRSWTTSSANKLPNSTAARQCSSSQCGEKGFKDVVHLKSDTDLNPLHQREDFQKLVVELEGKGK